ncbi:MAG TPA: prepilin-type N-terminal cleavage/methylation domain-containing protein [Mycobacteriales bacterium]|nr:prepilin-type N-terminal cleavage/methylation domain-containing protein [Mycobacteriales bacterium]
MSLVSFARRRILAAQSDEGFTLVEIMAALVVFALVAGMALAMLLTAVKGGLVAKQDTVGRNITQAKIEELRNLPYHIDQAVSTEYDLLDLYYPNVSGSAGLGATGYVPASGTRDTTSGDPSSGAFYRTVISAVPSFTQFSQYVAIQFVDSNGTAKTPPSTWSASTAGSDTPVTNMVNISVTTLWKVGKTQKKYNIFTSISAGRPLVPKVNIQGHLEGLSVTGLLPSGYQATLDASQVDFNASFSNIVTAAATALGARAAIEGGSKATGALNSVTAPPNVGPIGSGIVNGSSLADSGNTVGAFAKTDTKNLAAGSAAGQPYSGTSGSPVTADVLNNGGGYDLQYSNEPSSDHLGLHSSSNVVQVIDGASTAMTSTGYGTSSTSSTAHSATSNIPSLTTSWIQLFPTAQAPNGIVQIQVTQASLNCQTGANYGASSTASSTLTYAATLKYATWNGSSVSYTTVNLGSGNSTDPLPTSSQMATIQVGVDGSGSPIYLGDYISSWGSLTSGAIGAAPAVQKTSDNKSISANYQGLLTINSQPLRTGDATSGVGVTIGAISCLAVDYR